MLITGTKRKATTKADASLDASLELLQIADSLACNVGAGIEECIASLANIDAKGVAGVVRKLEAYKKSLLLASVKIESNVKATAMIGSVAYAHKRRKQVLAVDPLKGKSSQQKSSQQSSRGEVPRVSPRLVASNLAAEDHPFPANGKCYTTFEAVQILLVVDQKRRRSLMNEWIDSGLLVCSVRTIYRRLSDATGRTSCPRKVNGQ